MKVLFIGGTGIISSASSRLAVQKGIELVHLNRGTRAPGFPGVRQIKADIRDEKSTAEALQGEVFDCVVDWIAFTPDHIETDLRLFRGRTKQYIFISSASAYQKPLEHYLITESTPLVNPYWEYSRNKIRCEDLLMKEWKENGFPATIVRPSYTYNEQLIPFAVGGGYTLLDRMLKGKKIPLHGDGSSLWTMTHNSDFAKGFCGLLGNPYSIGQAFHITSDEVLTWNQIYRAIASAAGVQPKLVYLPSKKISEIDGPTGDSLLGDKSWSSVFDNTKIKRYVPGFLATTPFHEGIKATMSWFNADPKRQIVDLAMDRLMDKITEST
jgi:nucleoside-diphosphate-sugar epimerase